MSLVQNSSTIFGERQDLHASLKSLRSANRTNEQEGATGETLARKSNAALSKVYRPKLDLLSAASLNEIAQPTIKTKSISMITSDDLRILQVFRGSIFRILSRRLTLTLRGQSRPPRFAPRCC